MSLGVIGAGLPRTGTLSMKTALAQLGYGRCYHMEELFAQPRRSAAWARYFTGRQVNWDRVFDGYGAAVDAPTCLAWREIAAHYPEAKIVLTQRDADAWYASMRKTILADGYIESLIPSPIGGMIAPMTLAMMSLAGPSPPGSASPSGAPAKEAVLAMREAHDAAVIAGLPPERLLVFRVEEGWDPLCAFLGLATPKTPFPRVNDSGSFHAKFAPPVGR